MTLLSHLWRIMLSFLEALRSLGTKCVCVCVFRTVQSQNCKKQLLLNFLNCTLASLLPPSADQLCVPGVVVQCVSCHSPSCNLRDHEVIEVNPDVTFDPLYNILVFDRRSPKFHCLRRKEHNGSSSPKVTWRWHCCSLMTQTNSAFDASVQTCV